MARSTSPPRAVILRGVVRTEAGDLSPAAETLRRLNQTKADAFAAPPTLRQDGVLEALGNSVADLVNALFWIELERLRGGCVFSARYAILIGPAAMTEAGLHGAGATRAARLLSAKGARGRRLATVVSGVPPVDAILDGVFTGVDGIASRWSPADGPLIAAMLEESSDAKIGPRFRKNRSQIWKRRRTLMIESFRALREAAVAAADLADQARGG